MIESFVSVSIKYNIRVVHYDFAIYSMIDVGAFQCCVDACTVTCNVGHLLWRGCQPRNKQLHNRASKCSGIYPLAKNTRR